MVITKVPLKKGSKVKCRLCGKKHVVKLGSINGVETDDLMYIMCPTSDNGKGAPVTILVGMMGYKIQTTT